MTALKVKRRKGKSMSAGRTERGSAKRYREGWKEGFKKGVMDGFHSMYAADR